LFSHRVRPRCIVDAINPTVKWSARLNAAIIIKAGLIIHLKKTMQYKKTVGLSNMCLYFWHINRTLWDVSF
jgi:hypothetical protein